MRSIKTVKFIENCPVTNLECEIPDQTVKADKGKLSLSSVPTGIIKAVAHIRQYSTNKYHDPNNWKKVEKGRFVDALYHHWIAYIEGERIDPESGFPHLWHIACNLAYIIEIEEKEYGSDTRNPKL